MVSNLNLLGSRRRILLNTPHIETVSDTIASFKTDVATKLKGCKVYFTPKQEGEGDPSPDNVRPISGWDGVTIYISKRNFLVADEITFTSGKHINGSGAVGNSTYYKISNIIPCSHLAGKTISFNTIIASTSTTVTSIGFYKNKTINTDNCVLCAHRQSNSKAYTTVTVPSTAKYMVICLNTSITLDGKYIVEGSTPPQEIDTPTTITIPFPQTIYGGYVDLVKGEVVETEYYYDFANETPTWSSGLSNPNNQYFTPSPYMISGYLSNDNRTLCDKFKKVTNNTQGAGVRFGANNAVVYFYNMSELDEIEAAIDVRNYLKDNGVVIVYPLVTPNTYSIDPQTIKALRGINNIWSNANGNIEVSFYTH